MPGGHRLQSQDAKKHAVFEIVIFQAILASKSKKLDKLNF
jgi:hypothetical protein